MKNDREKNNYAILKDKTAVILLSEWFKVTDKLLTTMHESKVRF